MQRMWTLIISALLLTTIVVPALAAGPESREYRILLTPDHFLDPTAGTKAYWSEVRTIARELQIPISEVSSPALSKPGFIHYLDTAAFDLRKAGFLLTRVQYKPFSPTGIDSSPDFSLNFRFQHGVQELASAKPVAPAANFAGKTEFQEEIAVLGGTANQGVFVRTGTARVNQNITGKITDFAKIFPGLLKTGINHDLSLAMVRQVRIREVKLTPGTIFFGQAKGQVTISVWYLEGQSAPWIAEFAFVCDTPVNPGSIKAMRSAVQMEKLVDALRLRTRNWLWAGKSKPALVYGE